ncbi:MAG: HAD hydrolase-like protein, partial [Verrucomicrobiota bacterium]|nr:HAD hydrolase-like protein [Verrucomicrobiota bacterium]
EKILREMKIYKYFMYVMGLDNIYASGKLELGQKLINLQNHSLKKMLIIGDSVHDYQVANALNINCLLIANGHNSTQRLTECNVPVINDLEDLWIALK